MPYTMNKTVAFTLLIFSVGISCKNKLHTGASRNGFDGMHLSHRLKSVGISYAKKDSTNTLNLFFYNAISNVYKRNGYTPLWIDSACRVAVHSYRFLDILKQCFKEGLNPLEYQVDSIQYHMQYLDTRLSKNKPLSEKHIADFEYLMSRNYLKYAYHLLYGVYKPKAYIKDWHINNDSVYDWESHMMRYINSCLFEEGLSVLSPDIDQYGYLAEHLDIFYTLKKHLGLLPLPTEKYCYGDSSSYILKLKQKLALAHIPEVDTFSALFDSTLLRAIKEYQYTTGIKTMGIIDKALVRSFSVDIDKRITQLKVNMERYRWMPRSLPHRYIWVNIPAYDFKSVKRDSVLFEMKVIVGRPERPTPVFQSVMDYVVINPTWTIPPTILQEDIIEKMRLGEDILTEKELLVYDLQGQIVDPFFVDWSLEARSMPYKFVQQPGKKNALGRIKFIFPNPHFVFMHDTPSRYLFSRKKRAYSSGCIRLQHPRYFATHIINSPDWMRKDIDKVIDSLETKRIYLKDKVDVYMVYFTSFFNSDGALIFGKDIYGIDTIMAQTYANEYKF